MQAPPNPFEKASLRDSAIGHPLNKVDVLIEDSRKFVIGDREFVFNEDERIFFMEGPIDPSNYHNTPDGCNTCGEKWKKASDLQESHCDFCGISNCKKCLRKQRNFKEIIGGLNRSQRGPNKRGMICKLCDRKFFIKQMVQGTLKDITAHNTFLASALNQQENFKKEI